MNFTLSNEVPSQVQQFQAFPLGSHAFLLRWSPPMYYTGIMRYEIHYINGLYDVFVDPTLNHTKISGLESNKKFRLCIRARSSVAIGPR